MKVFLKTELYKMIHNKYFIIGLSVGFLLTTISAITMIRQYFQMLQYDQLSFEELGYMTNPYLPIQTLYNHWIGGEFSSLTYSLFYLLLPILASIPYGWSIFDEIKNGAARNILIRIDRTKYFGGKYFVTFLSGGIVVTVPLITNILLVAMFIPAIKPDVCYDIYYGVLPPDLWSNLFYTNPLLYLVLYLMLNFVFSGIFATFSLAISFRLKHKIAVMLFPFFLLLILHYAKDLFPDALQFEISPLNFLHASTIGEIKNPIVILVEFCLFLIYTVVVLIKREKIDVL